MRFRAALVAVLALAFLQAQAAPIVPSDIRVDALIKAKWGQTTNALGQATWNYYTPTNEPGSSDNYPCGKGPLALAQIMHYYHGPKSEGCLEIELAEAPKTNESCRINGVSTNLVTFGGVYDWFNMPSKSEDITGETQREAIGKLVYDLGVVSQMYYAETESATAYTFFYGLTPVQHLGEVFGYAQAMAIPSLEHSGGFDEHCMGAIFANLDFGRPCILHLSSLDGGVRRIVVVDGYGFADDGEPCFHLNFGCLGEFDGWYRLPQDLQGLGVSSVYGVALNISPSMGPGDDRKILEGSLSHALISGNVLDIVGGTTNKVANATIMIYKTGEAGVFATTNSASDGTWRMELPAGKYDIVAVSDKNIGAIEEFRLSSPWYSYMGGTGGPGNAWGVDVVLGPPNARVGGEPFHVLSRAIDRAREYALESNHKPVEILLPIRLDRAEEIDFDCVIFATNAVPGDSIVTRVGGAGFSVSNECSLVMSNVVFAADDATLVDVAAGGSLGISGMVYFDVGNSVAVPKAAAVKTADANGLKLLGPIDGDCGFTLYCTSSTNAGDAVGFCWASTFDELAALQDCVPHIANFSDKSGELRLFLQNDDSSGTTPPVKYKLVWYRQPVPFEDAVAYYVDANDKTNTAGRIDVMVDGYVAALNSGDISDGCVIGIRRDDTLSRPLAIGGKAISIVGEGVEVSVGPMAGFAVADGGDLSVSGISFKDYVGNALFLVDGEGAKLSVSNVAITAIEGTNMWSGAIAILKGSASVDDSVFSDCNATGAYNKKLGKSVSAYGGALYVADRLSIRNSTITNCSSIKANSGGGIYAGKNSMVTISGNMVVAENVSGTGNAQKEDDIHLANAVGANAHLVLGDVVTGEVGVFWGEKPDNNGFGNTNGMFFAEAPSEEVATNSVRAFFSNDVGSDVVAMAVQDGSDWKLQWVDAPVGPQPLPSSAGAGASVAGAGGSETKYYASVADAITVAQDGDTVVVLLDEDFGSDVIVSANVLLVSDGSTVFSRTNDCSIIIEAGASLTVSNVYFTQAAFFADAKKPLFDVRGGKLVLDDGAQIYGLKGDGARNAGAVSVWQGGLFEMNSGALIWYCSNSYKSQSDGCGRGAGVLVDDGKAVFNGGSIMTCSAYTGGGVFVGGNGDIEISGDTVISYNMSLDGSDNNLVVCDTSRLVLSGQLTGDAKIGYTEGSSGDTNVFGRVAEGMSDEEAAASATNFTHDVNGDFGVAVKNGESRLLVWSAALDDAGKYVDGDGNEYEMIAGATQDAADPVVSGPLYYTGSLQVGVLEGSGYTLSGECVGTNAGEYVATATLRPGYKWANGSSSATTNITWEIQKAAYDMSGVVSSFTNSTFAYTGAYQTYTIDESLLPEGVSVTYVGNRHADPGHYTVTAQFQGDTENYNLIGDIAVTMTIPAQPNPIWIYQSNVGATWTITFTNTVELCWYELYETNSLAGGFPTEGVAPVARRQASPSDVPAMKFERADSGDSLYWKGKAYPEDAFGVGDEIIP